MERKKHTDDCEKFGRDQYNILPNHVCHNLPQFCWNDGGVILNNAEYSRTFLLEIKLEGVECEDEKEIH